MWQSNGKALAAQCIQDGLSGDQCKLSRRLLNDFGSINVFWLLMVVAAYTLSCYIRAIRWRDMLKGIGNEVSRFNAFAAVMVGYFVNLGVPRLGELFRPTILTKYESVEFEKALGTIVLERIVDVILFACFIAMGFIFHFDTLMGYISENMNISGAQITLFIIAGATLGVIGLFFLRKIAQQDINTLSGFSLKLKKSVDGFVEGLSSIMKLPNRSLFIFQSLAIWALYFTMHLFAFYIFQPTSHLGLNDALLVFDFGSLGIVLPSPGGMGTYHFLVEESLSILDVERLSGFSFAMIIFFTINIGCNAILGFLSWVCLPLVNRKSQ